ncbi:MAG TPA: hypothetical protein DGT23_27000 [Micromonosporaceae bacterium]|nr:hypothetical protein [Micromonosporaceae bacterium]
MKRVLVVAAFAATLLTGAGTGLAAQPTPTPSPSSPSPAPSISLDPNTAVVCATSRTTVTEGIKSFTTEIEKAGTLATNGDLVGAEKSVKQSGTVLIDLAGKIRKDAEKAEKAELKTALEDVAKELESLGSSLTGITSLQNFDTQRLEALAQRVSELCGGG